MSAQRHYFVPESSKWPLIAAASIFVMLFGLASLIYSANNAAGLTTAAQVILAIGVVAVIWMMYGWFKDVIDESMAHKYDDQVSKSFRIGMLWFIFSEAAFFTAFFGALAYIRFFALDWLAGGGAKETTALLWPEFIYQWPLLSAPDQTLKDVADIINPFQLPLVNTILLVTSSFTLTVAHHALIATERKKTIIWLILTLVLGLLFIVFQAIEYVEAYTLLDLRFDSNVYGSIFFMATGFHGLHVTLGAIILFFVLLRITKGHFSADNHFAFEAGAWYWHFVDVVWIGLFLFVYIL